MSETIITDRKSALTVVRFERDRHAIVYPGYIAANGVTLDTVAAHVKALTELAFPGVKAASRAEAGTPERLAHGFACRVRNGLNSNLGKVSETGEATKYVTALGLKDESREQFLTRCAAEYDAAHGA